jgi:hypothetical protein
MRAAVFERQGLDNLNVKGDVQQPTITDYDVLIMYLDSRILSTIKLVFGSVR